MRTIVMFAIGMLSISCVRQSSTPQLIRDPQSLVLALEAAGAAIEQVVTPEPILDLPDPSFYRIDGALVQIGSSSLRMQEFQEQASAQPGLRIWFGDGWYLAYPGREGGVILLLSGVLGDPILATSVQLDEPFPPAVPRAMRRLSEELGVSPLELTVLDFQPATWSDSCLGIELADDCLEGEFAGWILFVEWDGTEYQLHSDEAGEIIRWREPELSGQQ